MEEGSSTGTKPKGQIVQWNRKDNGRIASIFRLIGCLRAA